MARRSERRPRRIKDHDARRISASPTSSSHQDELSPKSKTVVASPALALVSFSRISSLQAMPFPARCVALDSLQSARDRAYQDLPTLLARIADRDISLLARLHPLLRAIRRFTTGMVLQVLRELEMEDALNPARRSTSWSRASSSLREQRCPRLVSSEARRGGLDLHGRLGAQTVFRSRGSLIGRSRRRGGPAPKQSTRGRCLRSASCLRCRAFRVPQGPKTGEEILFSPSRPALWFDYFSNDNLLYEINNRLGAGQSGSPSVRSPRDIVSSERRRLAASIAGARPGLGGTGSDVVFRTVPFSAPRGATIRALSQMPIEFAARHHRDFAEQGVGRASPTSSMRLTRCISPRTRDPRPVRNLETGGRPSFQCVPRLRQADLRRVRLLHQRTSGGRTNRRPPQPRVPPPNTGAGPFARPADHPRSARRRSSPNYDAFSWPRSAPPATAPRRRRIARRPRSDRSRRDRNSTTARELHT